VNQAVVNQVARSGAVREDQLALQAYQLVGRYALAGELAKPGVDGINGPIFCQRAQYRGMRSRYLSASDF